MTTVGELIQKISFKMHSFSGVREQMTYLTSAIDADDLTLQVASAESSISQGLIEVDDEIMLVESVEGTTVRILPFGRGAEGSTAASHGINARVTNDPTLPRSAIFDNLKETVMEIHPDLFRVKKTTLTWNPVYFTYELPADVDRVLNVQFDVPGPAKAWGKSPRWTYNSDANTTEFPTGKSIEIYERVVTGYTVQVTYAAPYTTPTSTSQELSTLGIQETAAGCLIYGTCWRLAQSMEPARLQLRAAEQRSREEAVPAGSNTNLAKQWYAMFAQLKMQERDRLLTLNPSQIHHVRR